MIDRSIHANYQISRSHIREYNLSWFQKLCDIHIKRHRAIYKDVEVQRRIRPPIQKGGKYQTIFSGALKSEFGNAQLLSIKHNTAHPFVFFSVFTFDFSKAWIFLLNLHPVSEYQLCWCLPRLMISLSIFVLTFVF